MKNYLEIRNKRCEDKIIGLKHFSKLLNSLHLNFNLQTILLSFWPSLEGLCEWCTYTELDSGEVELAEIRHHYMKNLEGISYLKIKEVKNAFYEVENTLLTLYKYDLLDPEVGNLISLYIYIIINNNYRSLTFDYNYYDMKFLSPEFFTIIYKKITICDEGNYTQTEYLSKVSEQMNKYKQIRGTAWNCFSYAALAVFNNGTYIFTEDTQRHNDIPKNAEKYYQVEEEYEFNVKNVIYSYIKVFIFL